MARVVVILLVAEEAPVATLETVATAAAIAVRAEEAPVA